MSVGHATILTVAELRQCRHALTVYMKYRETCLRRERVAGFDVTHHAADLRRAKVLAERLDVLIFRREPSKVGSAAKRVGGVPSR